MNLLEAIQSRRSIRKFKPDAIPENYINELIEAGRLAPSGTNIQPTRYIVIKSEQARAKLKECTPMPFVAAAPVVIACCIDTQSASSVGDRIKELRESQAFAGTPLDKDSDNYNKKRNSMDAAELKAYLNLNAAIAIDHITLRAVDLGLGSCWVMMFDKEKVKDLLDLDDRYDIVALLPVGYPDQSPAQRPRLDFNEVLLKEI
ncbi:MAG: nitroreductase family protein [Clostridiales bacterium]|nr:nitroreductase family protein [Clostridiales bacterium]MCF8022094.1 nitroreductase family protein [Clostridiales bacterium]